MLHLIHRAASLVAAFPVSTRSSRVPKSDGHSRRMAYLVISAECHVTDIPLTKSVLQRRSGTCQDAGGNGVRKTSRLTLRHSGGLAGALRSSSPGDAYALGAKTSPMGRPWHLRPPTAAPRDALLSHRPHIPHERLVRLPVLRVSLDYFSASALCAAVPPRRTLDDVADLLAR